MSHEVESMMYVNETPWHGLGTKLEDPPASVVEALRLAGLDWSVSTTQLQLPNGNPVSRWAVVRSTDNAVLGTVGAGYRTLNNADAFSFFDPFIASGAARIDTAGSLRGGARVWMLAKIDRPDSVIVPKADDRISKYLLLAQGHDGALAIHVGLTPIRVVCHNTLSAAIPAARTGRSRGDVSAAGMFRVRHTAQAPEMLAQIQETLERADKDFEKAAEFFRTLAGKQIRSAAKLRAYVDAVFPPAAKDDDEGEDKKERVLFTEIEALFQKGRGNDLPGVKGTAWAAYNAVTEYLTWERGESTDVRMNNLWLRGSGAPGRAIKAAKDVLLAA